MYTTCTVCPRLERNFNSHLSSGCTYCLPIATPCSSQSMSLVEDDLAVPLPQQESLLVPDNQTAWDFFLALLQLKHHVNITVYLSQRDPDLLSNDQRDRFYFLRRCACCILDAVIALLQPMKIFYCHFCFLTDNSKARFPGTFLHPSSRDSWITGLCCFHPFLIHSDPLLAMLCVKKHAKWLVINPKKPQCVIFLVVGLFILEK